MNAKPSPDFKSIYILGGHKLATSYYQKITACLKNSKTQTWLIDPDPNCHAAQLNIPNIIPKSYADFITDYWQHQAQQAKDETLVPDHTAPHVMLRVFLDIVEKKHAELSAQLSPLVSDLQTPFVYKSENDAIWAVSYATWTCPADCDEPKICPHTQNNRDWDFNHSLKELFASDSKISKNSSAYCFACQPLVQEISHIPMDTILTKLNDFESQLKTKPPQDVIIATHSHCHGIIGKFSISVKNKLS